MLLPGVMPAMGIRPAPAYAAVILAHTVIYAYAAVLAAGAVFIQANAAAQTAEGSGGQTPFWLPGQLSFRHMPS